MRELLFFGLVTAFFIGWVLAMNFLRGKIKPDNSSPNDFPDDGGSGGHSYDGGHGGFDGFGGGESGGGGASADGH